MKDLLTGDIAVVTGGAKGNGRALAIGLAVAGAKVAIGDLDSTGARAVADEIIAAGGEAFGFALDVTDRAQCLAVPALVRKNLGISSILINNAGIIRRGSVTDESFLQDWNDTLDVNVHGCMNMISALLPDLKETQGRIVNLGSVLSFVGGPRALAYCSSKGAVSQITKALAVELAPDNIRVNGIAPGPIVTQMTAVTRADPEAMGRLVERTPMGRFGEPEELVGPVVFLASKLSTYVNGVMLPVDGGYLAK